MVFVRVAVAVRVIVGLPPVPVTVRVYDPFATDEETETVSVEELPVVEGGLNVAVAPAGTPLTEKATEALKPPVLVMLTV